MLHTKQTRLDLDEIYKREMSLDLIPLAGVVVVIGAGFQSPYPSQEGQHWSMSDVMCPG